MKTKKASGKGKLISVLLWILQGILAFYYVAGGTYMMSNYKILANPWALNMLPQSFWKLLGILQVLFAIGLVFPGMIKPFRKFVPISAIGLIIISLLGIVLYGAYSGSGTLWAIIPAVLLVFVAYKRFSLLK